MNEQGSGLVNISKKEKEKLSFNEAVKFMTMNKTTPTQDENSNKFLINN